MSGGRIRAEHLQCAWCDDQGKGSAQFKTGQWFVSCGKHGLNFEEGSEAWRS